MIRRVSILLFASLIPGYLTAQHNTLPDSIYNAQVLRILQTEDDRALNEALLRIEFHREQPININTAGRTELQNIPNITAPTIEYILEYRKVYGAFFSVEEFISALPAALHHEAIQILPYIRTGTELPAVSMRDRDTTPSENRIRLRGVRRDFAGSGIFDSREWRQQVKMSGHFAGTGIFCMQFEKDPGEQPLDYTSFFVTAAPAPGLRVILGDYHIRFGEGLAFAQRGLRLSGFGSEGHNRGFTGTFSPHTGTGENLFLRGIAFSYETDFFSFLPFVSINRIDAAYDSAENAYKIQTSGYHVSRAETRSANALTESVFGISAAGRWFDVFEISSLLYLQDFRENVLLGTRLIHRRELIGSVFAHTVRDRTEFSTEAAFRKGFPALISSVTVRHSGLYASDFSLYRLHNEYYALHGDAEQSLHDTPSNEEGMQMAFTYTGSIARFGVSASLFREVAPSMAASKKSGNAATLFYVFPPSPRMESRISVLYRSGKLAAGSIENPARLENSVYRVRIENDYRISPRFLLRQRMETARSYGVLQEQPSFLFSISGLFKRGPIKMTGRYYAFNAKGKESAFYPVEPDIPGAYFNTYLTGNGSRFSLSLAYNLSAKADCSVKYGWTSTGADAVRGKGERNEILIQIDWRY